jgi:hypothetical protein
MNKIFAFGSLLLGAFAHTHNHVHEVSAWPPLNLYTTFKADVTLHQFDGKTLKPFKGISAFTKVDGDRSKIHIDAKVQVPVFGKVDAEILIDTMAGTAQLYVPMLNICQQEDLPVKASLKELLLKFYSEEGGITVYDGEVHPAWDASNQFDKFHALLQGEDHKVTISAYVDQNTHNGRWLQEESDLTRDPKVIINVPKGEEPATFEDSEFVISGCTSFELDETKFIRIFRP